MIASRYEQALERLGLTISHIVSPLFPALALLSLLRGSESREAQLIYLLSLFLHLRTSTTRMV